MADVATQKIVHNRGMYPGDYFQQWMKGLLDRRAPTVDKLYECLKLPSLDIKQSRLEAFKGTTRAAKVPSCSEIYSSLDIVSRDC